MRYLFLLAILAVAACRKKPATAPDYDATRRRSERSHQDLDQQSR